MAPVRGLVLIGLGVLSLVLFAGCVQQPEAQIPEHEVWMRPVNIFEPATITVEVGTTVTWVNKDSVPHTATEDVDDGFDSGFMNQGERYAYTFKEPGTYTYHCIPHSAYNADQDRFIGMVGTVVVVAPEGAEEQGGEETEEGNKTAGNETA